MRGLRWSREPITAVLIDAKILLRGNAAPLYNHQQQITGGIINFPSLQTLHVEQEAIQNPFTLPLDHVGSLLRYTPDPGIQHRVHLRARVTLFWPGRLLCLQDEGDGDGLCTEVVQSAELRSGEVVDVIGFPTAGNFTPTLTDATYRSAGGAGATIPRKISTQQAMDGEADGKLVSMEGQVVGNSEGLSDPSIVLSADASMFTAVLPKNAQGEKLRAVEAGSRVRVTGVCSVQFDGSADPTSAGVTGKVLSASCFARPLIW